MKLKTNTLSGFTLLELLIVVAIVAILASAASPNLIHQYYFIKNDLLINTLRNEIVLARTLAIVHQQNLQYCAEPLWHKGRSISNFTGLTFRSFSELPTGYTLTLKNSLHQNRCIIFTPCGFTLEQRGSFYLKSPVETIRIVISLSGNIRTEVVGS